MANTFNLGNKKWAVNEGKVLAYNSENNNFKPLPFDFTRASSATVVNKEGLIEVVSNNEPRIDFLNDSKGALLLEPSRSNVLPYSSDFSQWSTASGASVVGNKLGVGGSNDAFEFFSDGTSSTRLFYTVSITGESSYSVFAKKNTLDYISLYANDDNNARVWFNLDNGTLGNQEGGGTGVIEDYGNGWYRCTLKWTPSNLVNVRIYNSNENDVFGGTAGSVYIQYAQLEAGSYSTSYIPTSGSSVTRVADACSQTPPSGIIGQTEGTMYAEIDFKSKPEAGSPIVGIMTLNNNVNNLQNCIILGIERQSGGINRFYPFVQVGNSTVAYITGGTLTDGNYKVAFAYKQNDFILYVNGVQIGTDTNGAVPTTSQFLVGERFNSDTFKIADGIKETKLYNTRLSNSELQVLTS